MIRSYNLLRVAAVASLIAFSMLPSLAQAPYVEVALYCVGEIHNYGDLVKQKRGKEWLRLGNICYGKPKPTAEDLKKAFDYFRLAAEDGNPCGENNLGLMFMNGQATTRDPQQALSWWRKSAAAGCGKAACSLAYAYRDGNGVQKTWLNTSNGASRV